jgi:uncharacterized membrane protein
MKPIVVETTRELAGPIELGWRVLTNWERQSDWMLEMSEIVVTSDNREGPGVEARATISIGGIRTTDLVRVDVWQPPNHLGLVHEGWVKGRGDIRLEPIDNGHTLLRWREELRPPWGILGVIGLRLFRPLIVRTFRRDLDVLQNIVFTKATPRYSSNTDDQT